MRQEMAAGVKVAMFRDSLEMVFGIADLRRGRGDAGVPGAVARHFVGDADESHRLLLEGVYPVVVMSLDDVISCAMSGHARAGEVVCFAPVHAGFLELVARPGIGGIEELKGKRIAVDTDTGYASALYEMLRRAGIDWRKDVTVVYAGATNVRYEKLMRGEFDATLLGTPYTAMARGRGFGGLGKPRVMLGGYQGTCFAGLRGWLAGHGEEAMGVVRGFRETVAWASDVGRRGEVELMVAELLKGQGAEAEAGAVTEELFGRASEFLVGEKMAEADVAVVVGLYEKARGVRLGRDVVREVEWEVDGK
jgi:ABC-type nitrate/sulfonate/bicarbonate transport system substrate-binding protein